MYNTVDELTVDYEEDGILKVKQIDKEILSKGSWATVLFRYQEWQALPIIELLQKVSKHYDK